MIPPSVKAVERSRGKLLGLGRLTGPGGLEAGPPLGTSVAWPLDLPPQVESAVASAASSSAVATLRIAEYIWRSLLQAEPCGQRMAQSACYTQTGQHAQLVEHDSK